MNKRTSLLALTAMMTAFATQAATAADLAPPPPPPPAPEIRASVSDWTGPYIGAVAGGTCMESGLDLTTRVENGTDGNADGVLTVPGEWDGSSTTSTNFNDLAFNGCGISGGFVAGFNYQVDNIVFGIEGDITWGSSTGRHTDIVNYATATIQRDRYQPDWQVSLRPRIGMLVNSDTLLYVTGGPSWMRGTLVDSGSASGTVRESTVTHLGYTIGGGIEHALTENIHLRAEYLYASYKAKSYGTFCGSCDTDGLTNTAAVDVNVDPTHLHTFRMGVSWNFPISQW